MSGQTPLGKKRGRQPRRHGLAVSGDGKFRPFRSFKWYKIPSGGTRIPAGSTVRATEGGRGVTVGGEKLPPGAMAADVGRR